MNNNRKVLATVLLVVSVIALIIGSTLAYWTWSSNNLVTVNITTNMGGIGLTLNGGTSAFNANDNSPAYVGYMYGTVYETSYSNGTGWIYAPDVTYENGTYTLTSKGTYNVETKS